LSFQESMKNHLPGLCHARQKASDSSVSTRLH